MAEQVVVESGQPLDGRRRLGIRRLGADSRQIAGMFRSGNACCDHAVVADRKRAGSTVRPPGGVGAQAACQHADVAVEFGYRQLAVAPIRIREQDSVVGFTPPR